MAFTGIVRFLGLLTKVHLRHVILAEIIVKCFTGMGTGIRVVREEGVEERILLNQALAKFCSRLSKFGASALSASFFLVCQNPYCSNDSMQL